MFVTAQKAPRPDGQVPLVVYSKGVLLKGRRERAKFKLEIRRQRSETGGGKDRDFTGRFRRSAQRQSVSVHTVNSSLVD